MSAEKCSSSGSSSGAWSPPGLLESDEDGEHWLGGSTERVPLGPFSQVRPTAAHGTAVKRREPEGRSGPREMTVQEVAAVLYAGVPVAPPSRNELQGRTRKDLDALAAAVEREIDRRIVAAEREHAI